MRPSMVFIADTFQARLGGDFVFSTILQRLINNLIIDNYYQHSTCGQGRVYTTYCVDCSSTFICDQ